MLKKHNRPVDLKAALRRSAGVSAEVIALKHRKKPRKRPAKKTKRRVCKRTRGDPAFALGKLRQMP